MAKKDDDDFLNILRSGTFDYEDGVSDTNYEVKTVSIPKKMNYSLTSNDIIQDNNQTNNSEPVKSNSLMKLDEDKKEDDDDNDDDDEKEGDDDDDISKKIEVVGMPNFNSPPPKPNKEIEENRRYKRKMPKIENPKSDDNEFNDDDDDDDDDYDNNNSVVPYDKEADRIDGDMEKALSVYSRRINDKPKQNITNTSVSVFAPGFNSRPKSVIPKLPTLPSEIINSRDEIIERLDTLERRNYKEISKTKNSIKQLKLWLEI